MAGEDPTAASEESLDHARPVREGEQLDEGKLSAWLSTTVGGGGPLHVEQFRGGHSNLTYLVRWGERELVLRRPPFGSKVKKAHDMGREHRVLSALAEGWGKVPRPVAFCDDASVLGCDFYLTERLHGVIYRKKLPPGLPVSAARARRLCEALVDTLVELHAVDPAAVGLADLGKPEGFVKRQVDGWTERYRASQTDDIPAMTEVGRWLVERIPTSPAATLIHNDYKFDNVMFDAADVERPIAVFDWEMSTLGDPLMDLGTALAYWVQADDDAIFDEARMGPTHLEGCLTRQQVAERYAEKSGRSIDDVVFYQTFGLYKTAVVTQQIYYRFKQGLTRDERFAAMLLFTQLLAQRAADTIERDQL